MGCHPARNEQPIQGVTTVTGDRDRYHRSDYARAVWLKRILRKIGGTKW